MNYTFQYKGKTVLIWLSSILDVWYVNVDGHIKGTDGTLKGAREYAKRFIDANTTEVK